MPELSAAASKFVLHWGELGTRWGINRTVAQIYALLFVSEKALTAEEIAESLCVARSNVSTSLKELQGWGIIRIVHVLGDRRDHFESMKDVWEMFRVILAQRKQREVDPIMGVLREWVAEAKDSPEDKETLRNLSNLLEMFESLTSFYDQINRMPTKMLLRFVRLGDKMTSLFDLISP
jgi:DNA-binding transcriptional regulator GbsR (MarR family)